MLGFGDEELVDVEEVFGSAGERDECNETDEGACDHTEDEFWGDGAPLAPAIEGENGSETGEDEEGVFFGHDHGGEANGEGEEATWVMGHAEIFPEEPKIHEGPESEESIDHPVLGEMDLHGGEAKEGEGSEHGSVATEASGEEGGRDEEEDGEEAGDGLEGGESGGIGDGPWLVEA